MAEDLPTIDHGPRIAAVQNAQAETGDDAWLFENLSDVRWLTGFSGSHGWVVLRGDDLTIGTDRRYEERAAQESAGTGAVVIAESERAVLHDRLLGALRGARSVGLDPAATSHARWEMLAADVELRPSPSAIARLRMVKDDAEIARIETAAVAADAALADVEPVFHDVQATVVTEADVRDELEYRMRIHGADDRSYETIVASGPDHAARPHHEVQRRPLEIGDTVIVDVGALVDGYHSDMTRAYVIGEPTDEQAFLYGLVAAAQRAGIDALRPGVTAASVDLACREVFDGAGYGDWFLHGTGHGVGLDIHELPFHSRASTDGIEQGYVVTIEPGLYRGGFGGIRIEDLFVVTEHGSRPLTHTPQLVPPGLT